MAGSSKTGNQEFGDLLRRGRERLGMSRRDLAAATDLSYPYISQLETGYRQPSADAIRNLAGVLNIGLDDMFAALEKDRSPDEASNLPLLGGSSAGGPMRARLTESPVAQQSARKTLHTSPAAHTSEPEVLALMQAPSPEPRFEPPAADPADVERIVYQVVGMLSTLPPEQRLDAVAELQAKVVQSVIDDGLRGRR